jgi:hypothetical protein
LSICCRRAAGNSVSELWLITVQKEEYFLNGNTFFFFPIVAKSVCEDNVMNSISRKGQQREEEKIRFQTAVFSSFKLVSWIEEELIFHYSSSFALNLAKEQQQ